MIRFLPLRYQQLQEAQIRTDVYRILMPFDDVTFPLFMLAKKKRLVRAAFCLCVGHDTILTGERPVTGRYRQV